MKSSVLAFRPPLRWKSQTSGVPRLQGVYRIKDEMGFPIDMSYEIAKEKKWDVDWIEALSDAGRQCPFKLEALFKEIEILVPHDHAMIRGMFIFMVMDMDGETICEKCSTMHRRMWAIQ